MKQCPACKTTYTDDSLSFCLSDGSSLASVHDEEPTVVRSGHKGPQHAGPPPESEPTVLLKPESHNSGTSTAWIKIAIGVIILGIAAIAVLGLAGAVLYYNTGGTTPTPTPSATPTPRAAATPTPDLEKERLKDEIANIQKQLDERKRNPEPLDPGDKDDVRDPAITATVDSPNDGFLALRSQPDSERGERLAQIPHGAEIEILRCTNSSVTIGGRSGRWCYVDYNGRTGWVFDAWLEY